MRGRMRLIQPDSTKFLTRGGITISEPTAAAVGDTSYDLLVDAGGDGDHTTIQAAINANPKTIWVKNGTYDEDLTVDEAELWIYFEPGTTIDDGAVNDGTITVSAADVTLEFGSGCTVDGAVAWSGDNGRLKTGNGCIFNSTFQATGDKITVDGGGWGTTFFDRVTTNTSSYDIFDNFFIDTKTNAANNNCIVQLNAADLRSIFTGIRMDSDLSGYLNAANVSNGNMVSECYVEDADVSGISNRDFGCRMLGNYIVSPGAYGIGMPAVAAVQTIVGNIINGNVDDAIYVVATSNENIIVGNRVEPGSTSGEAIDDDGSDMVVASNDETAI